MLFSFERPRENEPATKIHKNKIRNMPSKLLRDVKLLFRCCCCIEMCGNNSQNE